MSRTERFAVLRYHSSWSPNRNVGLIQVELEGQAKPWLIRVDNAAEFSAILLLLGGSRPVFGTGDGWLTTTTDGPVK